MGKKNHAKRKVAAIGTFDGLHKGHQRVFSTAEELAGSRNLDVLIITFDRHPRHIVDPSNAPRFLMHPDVRDRRLRSRNFSVLTLEFTRSTASISAETWLRTMHDEYDVDVLVLGYDNKFGCDGRQMCFEDYIALGEKIGVDVVSAPVEKDISSTAIRNLVKEGKVREARELMGHPFMLTGVVVPGKNIGHKLGFPTANIQPDPLALIPATGVYAADIEMPDGSVRRSAVNIGHQPTVADSLPLRIEAHVADFDGDLYGRKLNVSFLDKIRDEMKFDSLDALIARLSDDIKNAKELK